MERTEILSLFKNTPADGTEITVCGWAKNIDVYKRQAVLCAHILPKLLRRGSRRVLFIATGALMSQTTFLQKEDVYKRQTRRSAMP